MSATIQCEIGAEEKTERGLIAAKSRRVQTRQLSNGLCWLLKRAKTVENRGPSKFFEIILEKKDGMGKNGMEAWQIWIFMAHLFTFTPQCAHYCTILHAKKVLIQISNSHASNDDVIQWNNPIWQQDSAVWWLRQPITWEIWIEAGGKGSLQNFPNPLSTANNIVQKSELGICLILGKMNIAKQKALLRGVWRLGPAMRIYQSFSRRDDKFLIKETIHPQNAIAKNSLEKYIVVPPSKKHYADYSSG